MRYYLIRDTNTILFLHKTYDSISTIYQMCVMPPQEKYLELVRITTNEFGEVVETLLLESFSKDSGPITHSYCIHSPQ